MSVPGSGATETDYLDLGGAANCPARFYRFHASEGRGQFAAHDSGFACPHFLELDSSDSASVHSAQLSVRITQSGKAASSRAFGG